MSLIIEQHITHADRENVPGRNQKLIGRWDGQIGITVHGTGNFNAGTGAQMHAIWQDSDRTGSGSAIAGWVCVHAYVDDERAIATWPFDTIGYHAGDGCENATTDFGCWSTLGIEGCESSTVDRDQMQENFAELIALIHLGDNRLPWGDGHTRGKVSIDQLWQHFAVSQQINPHDCPNWLRHKPNGWGQFMLQIDAKLNALTMTTPPPPPPGLPRGMTERLAEALYGVYHDRQGNRYSFNPNGSRSKRWLQHGADSIPDGADWSKGIWPSLQSVYTEGSGKGRKILQYSDGWIDAGG